MSLTFITGNQNKLLEAQAILPDLVGHDLDLPEIQELDPQKIIEAKLAAAEAHGLDTYVVEDTSLSIESLGGLPGPLIKWFLQSLGVAGLAQLALTKGPAHATATCMIGYHDTDGTSTFFSATQSGRIVHPRGSTTFGWDPIFVPDGHNITFAEMSPEQKRAISMRTQVFTLLKQHLS
jgi:non-canonical purine NTP pyrophosphatase (RdgB/HAM1 family)